MASCVQRIGWVRLISRVVKCEVVCEVSLPVLRDQKLYASYMITLITMPASTWQRDSHRLKDPSAWTDDVQPPKRRYCFVERGIELLPVCYVCFDEDSFA